MSTYGPAAALQGRLITLLRADGTLCLPNGLLYPDYAPKLDDNDLRVWQSSVQFPVESRYIYALPRVLVEVTQRAHTYEQDEPGVLQGPARVWIHSLASKEDEERAERIDAYIASLLLSTWLTDPSIIAARLSTDGDRRKERVDVFNGAWHIVTGYSTPNVGSLA